MRREVRCPERRGLSARGLKASVRQLGCRRSIRSAPEGLAALMDPSSNGKQELRASRLFYGSGKYVYTKLCTPSYHWGAQCVIFGRNCAPVGDARLSSGLDSSDHEACGRRAGASRVSLALLSAVLYYVNYVSSRYSRIATIRGSAMSTV